MNEATTTTTQPDAILRSELMQAMEILAKISGKHSYNQDFEEIKNANEELKVRL